MSLDRRLVRHQLFIHLTGLGFAFPMLFGKRQPRLPLESTDRLRRRKSAQKILGDLGREIRKNLQWTPIILLQSLGQPVQTTRLMLRLPEPIPRQQSQLCRLIGVRQQDTKMHVVDAEVVAQNKGIKPIVVRTIGAIPISSPIQRLRVERIHRDTVVQEKLDHPPVGPLQAGQQFHPFGHLALIHPPNSDNPSAVHTTFRRYTSSPASSNTNTVHE